MFGPRTGELATQQKMKNVRKECPGPSAQYLGTWDLGNSNSSTGFG